MHRLYLDMDGVLMDYEGAIQAAGVPRYKDGAHWISRPRSEWPPEMIAADKAYVACMERPDFWAGIKPMSDAHALWAFCRRFNPCVLTAAPTDRDGETKFAAIRERIASDKRHSIWKYFDALFEPEHIHVCLRAEKAKFAEPGAVLVDDTPGNCAEWEANGGTAILHTSAADTIAKLRVLLDSQGKNKVTVLPPLRPKTSAERKAEPIHSGVLMYFPDALAAIARWSVIGNKKHNPGEALGWARGKSMDQMDAAIRHSLNRDKMDPDGELEAVPLAWRALAELQILEEKRLKALGIMPYSGIVP